MQQEDADRHNEWPDPRGDGRTANGRRSKHANRFMFTRPELPCQKGPPVKAFWVCVVWCVWGGVVCVCVWGGGGP